MNTQPGKGDSSSSNQSNNQLSEIEADQNNERTTDDILEEIAKLKHESRMLRDCCKGTTIVLTIIIMILLTFLLRNGQF